jgi:hypothetical protein
MVLFITTAVRTSNLTKNLLDYLLCKIGSFSFEPALLALAWIPSKCQREVVKNKLRGNFNNLKSSGICKLNTITVCIEQCCYLKEIFSTKIDAVIPTEAYLPLLPPFVPIHNYLLAHVPIEVQRAVTLLVPVREVLGSNLGQDISYTPFAVFLSLSRQSSG